MDADDLLRCDWCHKRCRDRADLKAHHDDHRREDFEDAIANQIAADLNKLGEATA